MIPADGFGTHRIQQHVAQGGAVHLWPWHLAGLGVPVQNNLAVLVQNPKCLTFRGERF